MPNLSPNTTVAFATTSGWFSGHFPGDPILPGVAQLKAVADCIEAAERRSFRLSSLSRIKFKRIVRPDEQLHIHVTRGKEQYQYTFSITCDGDDVCSGKMTLSPLPLA